MHFDDRSAEPFQPGDQIRVGIHVGLYVGHWTVIHAEKGTLARLVPYSAFANGNTPQLVARVPPHLQAAAVARALEKVGERYDVLSSNCEHLANFAQTGMAFSPTLRVLSAIGIVAAVMWLGRTGA